LFALFDYFLYRDECYVLPLILESVAFDR